MPRLPIGEEFNVGRPCGLGDLGRRSSLCVEQHCCRSGDVPISQQVRFRRIELDNSRPRHRRARARTFPDDKMQRRAEKTQHRRLAQPLQMFYVDVRRFVRDESPQLELPPLPMKPFGGRRMWVRPSLATANMRRMNPQLCFHRHKLHRTTPRRIANVSARPLVKTNY